MEEEIKLLNSAYEIYNLDDRENLSNKILNYIADRLLINRNYINQLIEILNLNITFTDIWNAFEEERKVEEHYKETKSFRKISDNYFMGIYATSKGNIVIETDSVIDIIKYFVDAIKTRNTITISKLEYNEVSIESVILVIFCEALNKFGLDRNLLMIIPYEECFYDKYDEVIINEDGKIKIEDKEFSTKYAIYIENESFKDDVEKEKQELSEKGYEFEIYTGEFYETIEKINKIKPIGAVIYTDNSENGYKFINLIHSNNVFVNTTLLNSEDFSNEKNDLYLKKKIIYPMLNYDNNVEKIIEEQHGNTIDSFIEEEEDSSESELGLTIKNSNTWYRKIINAIKKFFNKK